MPATIISDTSCLILLDKINELRLLELVFGEVCTTPIVKEEFGRPLPDWIKIASAKDILLQASLAANVDQGEASAIALALEQDDCLLIIDESKGRKLAIQLGLRITGTLGIIVEAKIKGHIPSVKPILDKIRQTNFYISNELQIAVMKSAGEI